MLDSIFGKSKGVKRTLASAFAFIGLVAAHVPALAPWSELINQIAGALGGVAVLHPLLSK